MEMAISNPMGSHVTLSPTLVGRTVDGAIQSSGGERYATFRASAAIAKGTACAFNVVPVAGTPVSVNLMAVADSPAIFAGIAVNAAAAGAQVVLCTDGFVDVFMNAQTSAFGEFLLAPLTNAGEASRSAVALAATTISGTVLGTVLAVKTAGTNLALCYIARV